jgi:hypothetical protein
MADALFTINADSSNQGFDATPSQVLTLRLKTLPVSGVQSVRFQVWDATAFDPDLDPIQNPPRKAKDSPNLTLVGSTSGPNVSPVTVDGTVSVTMPGSDNHSWIVRCVVNGGLSELPDGRLAFDPRLVHERMIVIRDSDTDGRPVIATETTQYEDDGWAPECGRPGAAGAPFTPEGGTGNGFLSRHVYVNAASSRLNTSHIGVTCEAATTWTTAAHIPPGNFFDVQVAGPGGGGSGANTTEGGSGPGGGGGARRRQRYSRRDLIAMLPIVMTCPLGAAKGLGGQTNNAVQTVTATSGGNGTTASFGNLTAGGGSGGIVGNTGKHGGTGGGTADAPQPGNVSTAALGGVPATVAGVSGQYLDGAGHPSTASGNTFPGLPAVYGGASGGSSVAGAEVSAAGGRAVYGGGGGGSGRSTDLTVGGGANGADGGGRMTGTATSGGGGSGGPGTALDGIAPAAAGNGADGAFETNGDGGGGGGSHDGNTTTMIAGAGGNGGFPGGGGGGGGATRIRTFSGRTCIGGDGGLGGDSCIIVDAYA